MMLGRIAVLNKELSGRMRGWRAPLILTLYLALLGGLGILYLRWMIDTQVRYAPGTIIGMLGPQIFSVLAIVQLLLIIFIVPSLTAGSIAGERERQTFDILLTTRLSSGAIVLGKLLASIGYMLFLIVAALPLFSLAFLFGGVSPRQFWLTIALALLTAINLGSISLFISTVTRRIQVAVMLSYLVAFALSFGISILSYIAIRQVGQADFLAIIYLSPLAALESILTSSSYAYGGYTMPIPTGYYTAYSPANPIAPVPPPFWAVHFGIDAGIIILMLLLSILFVRPHYWRERLALIRER